MIEPESTTVPSRSKRTTGKRTTEAIVTTASVALFGTTRSRLPVQSVRDAHEVEPPRRRGRAGLGTAAPGQERADLLGAELEHRPDERAHHVTEVAVGGDLEVEMVIAANPFRALDDAHEHVVLRLGRREGTEIVLADEQSGCGLQWGLVEA